MRQVRGADPVDCSQRASRMRQLGRRRRAAQQQRRRRDQGAGDDLGRRPIAAILRPRRSRRCTAMSSFASIRLRASQVAALDHHLAIIFGRAFVVRRDCERCAIIALGNVVAVELAVGEAEIGEHVGMRAEGRPRALQRVDRVLVAMLVDQATACR